MTEEQYIEHEVRLRVMKETNDLRFKFLESVVKETRNLTRLVVGGGASAIIIPIINASLSTYLSGVVA